MENKEKWDSWGQGIGTLIQIFSFFFFICLYKDTMAESLHSGELWYILLGIQNLQSVDQMSEAHRDIKCFKAKG